MNNPQNLVFNILQKKDPQLASTLRQCISNGETPKQVLQQLIEAGKVSRNDISKIRNNLGMINRVTGLKLSSTDINQLESMFDNTGNPNQTSSFRF